MKNIISFTTRYRKSSSSDHRQLLIEITTPRHSQSPKMVTLDTAINKIALSTAPRHQNSPSPVAAANTMASLSPLPRFTFSPKVMTQDAAMMELSRSILEREAEINSIQRELSYTKQQRRVGDATNGNEAYTQLLVKIRVREEELRVAAHENQLLSEGVMTLRKQVNGLKMQEKKSAIDVVNAAKMEEERKSMTKKIASLQAEINSQREAFITAEDIIKKTDELIEQLRFEKEKITKKSERSEDTVKRLSYLLLVNEKRIGNIVEENAGLIAKAKKVAEEMASKDMSLSLQRKQIDEQNILIKNYEKRFLAKGMDVPKSMSCAIDCQCFYFAMLKSLCLSCFCRFSFSSCRRG
jgi:hypothetical protein